MSSKIWVSVIATVLVLGGGTWAAVSQNKPTNKMEPIGEKMKAKETGSMSAEDEKAKMAKENEAMTKKDTIMSGETEKDSMMIKKEGTYKDYSPETVTSEQKAGQKVVLFFHATWCPECKAANAALKANPEKIPSGVTILKTDYDSNTALKTKYGVTVQHTFVQIDNEGKMVTKWVSGDVDMLIKNIK